MGMTNDYLLVPLVFHIEHTRIIKRKNGSKHPKHTTRNQKNLERQNKFISPKIHNTRQTIYYLVFHN